MKPTFLNHNKPLLTAMIEAATPKEIIKAIKSAYKNGADAFGIQLERIKKEYRTEENFRKMFSYCKERPIYITSYKRYESEDLTYDECMDLLLLGLKCGATLCDVMGDCYHKEEKELTFDEEAVKKQTELIEKIHSLGGEVLMSSHTGCFLDKETVLMYADTHLKRGADITKIVTRCDNSEEEIQNFNIIHFLSQNLEKPFLFLAGGTNTKLIRRLGPSFGVCMYLAVDKYLPLSYKEQPPLKEVKNIRNLLFKQ